MTDISWLSNQAHQIHGVFLSLFYILVTVLLSLGVFIEYFKWPLGGVPSFSVLVGRALVAALLLNSYSMVSNTIAEIADTLARQLGDLNQFKVVLSHMGDQLKTMSFSWVSVRDTITMLFSFVTFFLLYFSVHVVEAFLMYAWVLLYVFSPVLIAFFVLPSTASATKAMYRTLIEMSCWKIVWSVLATLLWSAAVSDINKPNHDVSYITSICYNLILAGSVLLTPMIVHSLACSGLSGMAQSVGSIAVGSATFSPRKLATSLGNAVKSGISGSRTHSEHSKSQHFSRYSDENPSNKRTSAPSAKRKPSQPTPNARKLSRPVTKIPNKPMSGQPIPPPPSDQDAPHTESTLTEI